MDQYATFGPQANFTPKPVDHVVTVTKEFYAGVTGRCACGKWFHHIPLPQFRRRATRHAETLIDNAPGAW